MGFLVLWLSHWLCTLFVQFPFRICLLSYCGTLVSGARLIVVNKGYPADGPYVLVCPQDAFTAMGFPISEEAQEVCGGVKCAFSRNVHRPFCRSARSQFRQIGNAMHVNQIGAVSFTIMVLFQRLGRKIDPIPDVKSKSPPKRWHSADDSSQDTPKSKFSRLNCF